MGECQVSLTDFIDPNDDRMICFACMEEVKRVYVDFWSSTISVHYEGECGIRLMLLVHNDGLLEIKELKPCSVGGTAME